MCFVDLYFSYAYQYIIIFTCMNQIRLHTMFCEFSNLAENLSQTVCTTIAFAFWESLHVYFSVCIPVRVC